MNEQRIKLGLIYSSSLLNDHILKIIKERSEEILVSMVNGLNEAIPVGRNMQEEGAEVIISRRGTADLLRENLHIPVLSLPVSSLDILASLNKAVLYGKKILLPVFRETIKDLNIVNDIFKIELRQGIYEDSESLKNLISAAKTQGIEVIIGGGVSMRLAEEYRIRSVEIPVSEESLIIAIESAKSVVKAQRNELEKRKRYQTILDLTSDGIISVDQRGIITTINEAAKDYLNFPRTMQYGLPLAKYLGKKSNILKSVKERTGHFNKMESIQSNFFVTNCTPIHIGNKYVGAVSTFKDISNVMAEEKEVRRAFAKGLVAKYEFADFIYQSNITKQTIDKARNFSKTDLTVLIYGETGTGKELIAQSIHRESQRKKGPFVSINCASLPDQLLENELFGHEEGAFTGSRKGGKQGLFEMAHKGTIFLDEIMDTSANVQSRLLRILQEKEVMRIGGSQLIPVDVRVIAATNRKLGEEVYKGKFREDLFFRLNVLNINIPPLRERIADIPILIKALIRKIANKYNVDNYDIPTHFIQRLMEYPWPGNVRQLENFLERLLILSTNQIDKSIFEELFRELNEYTSICKANNNNKSSRDKSLIDKKEDDEMSLLQRILEKTHYNKKEAAKLLGVSRTTLWRKLKKK